MKFNKGKTLFLEIGTYILPMVTIFPDNSFCHEASDAAKQQQTIKSHIHILNQYNFSQHPK